MLKDKGIYIICVPVTGTMEHGLYQFSTNFFSSIQKSSYVSCSSCYFKQSKAKNKTIIWDRLLYFIERTNLVIYSFFMIRKNAHIMKKIL